MVRNDYNDVQVSGGLLCWVFFAACLFAAALTALVYWSKS
jgi:hypothetical protein